MCPERKMSTICSLSHPDSESYSCLRQTQAYLLRVEGVTYGCRGRGALLSLPHGGHRDDVIHIKVFEKYIRDHVVSWFNWSRDIGLPVERMEDLVLVYGCTLVTSWAVAAFVDYIADAQISLTSRTLNNGGASFVGEIFVEWWNITTADSAQYGLFKPRLVAVR